MRGFIYRLGVKIRDAGDNTKNKFCAGILIKTGKAIVTFARKLPGLF